MGGYFTPVTGNPIKTSEYDTYVRDQVISQFPSTAARDSAITSPVNGMFCTDTGTGYTWRYNGSKWLLTPFEILVTTNHSWTSTATPTAVTSTDTTPNGGVQFAAEANCRYVWELDLHTQAPAGIGLLVQINYPTGGSADVAYVGSNSAGNFISSGTQSIATATSIGIFGGNGATAYTRMHGQVATAGTAGTFQLQFAQGSINASPSFLLIGTTLRFRQVA